MKCIYKIKFVVVKRKTLLTLFNKFLKILKKFFNLKKTFKKLYYRKFTQIKIFLDLFFFFYNCFWWNTMCYRDWSFFIKIRYYIPKNMGNEKWRNILMSVKKKCFSQKFYFGKRRKKLWPKIWKGRIRKYIWYFVFIIVIIILTNRG